MESNEKQQGRPKNDPGIAWDGSALRMIRNALGWNQAELGGMVGVSDTTVSKWELGEFKPSLEDVEMLEIALRMPANAFSSQVAAAKALAEGL